MRIILSNHMSKLVGEPKIIHKLREDTAIKHPNSFWSPARQQGRWDGKVRFITEGGAFATGMFPMVLAKLKEYNKKVEVDDSRDTFKSVNKIAEIGDKTLFTHQAGAIEAVIKNKVEGISFPRGILWEATNGGKSLIAAGLYASYHSKRVWVLLIDNTKIFHQLLNDLKEYLGNDIVGEVSSKRVDWKKFNVCMVQTLANRIKSNPKIRRDIQSLDGVLCDEADGVVNRKDFQFIARTAYNAPLRIALTGTAFTGLGMKKHELRNMEIVKFFGPVLHRTTNKDLIKEGISVPPRITFRCGNLEEVDDSDYTTQYDEGITKNKKRHRRVWKIVRKRLKLGPVLITFRYRAHARRMVKAMPEDLKVYRHEIVDGTTKNSAKIFEEFNNGNVEILLGSMVIKRGMNLPAMRALVNAAGGDSESTIIQILGRGVRKDKNKDRIYIDEFYDTGRYLQRHSKHRIKYYKAEGFEVKELYKKGLKKFKLKNY